MERIIDIVLVLAGCVLSLAASGGLVPANGAPAVAPVLCLLLAVIAVFGCEWASTRWRVLGPLAYCALAACVPDGLFMLPAVAYELFRFVRESLPWRAVPLALLVPAVSAVAMNHVPAATFSIIAALTALAALVSLRTSALFAQRSLCHRTRDDLCGRELSGADERARREAAQQVPSRPDQAIVSTPASMDLEDRCRAAFSQLTDREYDVVRLIAEGLDNHEIAAAAFISEGTVRNRISSALQKSGRKNRTQLAAAWWQAREG